MQFQASLFKTKQSFPDLSSPLWHSPWVDMENNDSWCPLSHGTLAQNLMVHLSWWQWGQPRPRQAGPLSSSSHLQHILVHSLSLTLCGPPILWSQLWSCISAILPIKWPILTNSPAPQVSFGPFFMRLNNLESCNEFYNANIIPSFEITPSISLNFRASVL